MRMDGIRRGIGAAGIIFLGTLVTASPALADASDCCMDLEARIAELESTTARKGNRKVSLVDLNTEAKYKVIHLLDFDIHTIPVRSGSTPRRPRCARPLPLPLP